MPGKVRVLKIKGGKNLNSVVSLVPWLEQSSEVGKLCCNKLVKIESNVLRENFGDSLKCL